jgi:hypothetical protein
MQKFHFESNNIILIINSKVGDKILASNTDSLLSQFNLDFEQITNGSNDLNVNGNKKINKTNEDTDTKQDMSTKSSPCAWKFYQDKKNDEHYKLGYRIQMTLQKVSLMRIKFIYFCFFIQN